jgi:hypothetical protein
MAHLSRQHGLMVEGASLGFKVIKSLLAQNPTVRSNCSRVGQLTSLSICPKSYFDTASARPTADHLPPIIRDHADDFPLEGAVPSPLAGKEADKFANLFVVLADYLPATQCRGRK